MRLTKVMKKIAAIGIGTTMLGATMFGAMAADISKYPSPFIQNGKFDGILVVGTGGTDPAGLASDILGVTDIAIGLQTSATTSAGGGATVTSVQGDSWRVGTSNKKYELSESYDNTSSHTAENFNSQISFIDDGDLHALASGQVQNNKGSAKYNQYLHFTEKITGSLASDTGYATYTEDDDDVTADFLFFKNNKPIALYEAEFTSSFESDVEDSSGTITSTGTFLSDYEDEEITLLGRTYTIVRARISPASGRSGVKLTLFGGSEKLIMEEGETRTVTIGDKEFEVTVDSITDTGTIKAKFTINGESTRSIQDGDSDKLSDGTELGVTDIIPNEAGDVTNDLVEFYIGAQKLVIEDTDVTSNTVGEKALDIGDESIDGTKVIIAGSNDNSTFKIDNIKVNMTAQDDYYVGNGETLGEDIKGQGDEAEVLFTNNWDIKYLGLEDVDTEEITLKTSGKQKYKLGWMDWGGNDVSVGLAYTPSGSIVDLGSDDDALIFNETINITKKDYFIVTDVSKEDGKRPTYLMRYDGSDKSTDSNPKIKLSNVGSGENLEKTYTSSGEVNFNIGGAQYKVKNATSAESNDFDVKVDLNGDGSYNNAVVAINTKAGAKISVKNQTANEVHVNITTPDNDDYEDLVPASNDFRITAASGEIDLTETGPLTFRTPEDEDNVNYAYNTMGSFIKWTSPTSDPDEVSIMYPVKQRLPQVYVTSGAVETKVSGGAGTENVNINPIEGGFAKLDRDVSSAMIAANNVMALGGPCVNSVSAELLGLPAGTCGSASGIPENKAMIKVMDNGEKIAMVVAGWTAEDTQRAARVLRYYDKYAADLVGMEVEISGTTLSDITVGKPSPKVAEEVAAEVPAADETTTG